MDDKYNRHLFMFLIHTEWDDCGKVADAIAKDIIDNNTNTKVDTELKRLMVFLRLLSIYKNTREDRIEKFKRVESFVLRTSPKQAHAYFGLLSSMYSDTQLANFNFQMLEDKVKSDNMPEGYYLLICDMMKEVYNVRKQIECY